MKAILLPGLLRALSLASALQWFAAAAEPDLLAILESDAPATRKCDACLELGRVGTPKSVPALAALLTAEPTAHAARHALETMPGPEAVAALRQALGRTAGPIQAGLIDSLGRRRDAESVPLLASLLASQDTAIAASAAAALGRIGTPAAATALEPFQDSAAATLRPVVFEALLECAERRLASGDAAGAAALYRRLFNAPPIPGLRAAAWRGLVLADAAQRPELVRTALSGTDRALRLAACKALRELPDRTVLQACRAAWPQLPAEAQLAVLDAQLAFPAEAAPAVRAAGESQHLEVRVAALLAWADLNDAAALPILARATARGEPAERDAARQALERIRGPGVREAWLARLASSEPTEQAELLRALGERGDRDAAGVLLEHAKATNDPVRLAALGSLERLALPDTLSPLLDLAAGTRSDDRLAPVLKALYAVCQSSPDKNQTTRQVVETLGRVPAPDRGRLLPLLAELGTPAALAAATQAARDQDPGLARQAVRVLGQWPDASPAPRLVDLARSTSDATLHALALRGSIDVLGHEPDPAKRLAGLEPILGVARRPDEKRQALAQLAQIPTPQALAVVLPLLADADLVNEAALAAITIAEKLAATNHPLADDAARQVLAHCQAPDTVRRAWALRQVPVAPGPFIRDWVVCGPYRQAGVTGATALFDVVFAPEKPGENPEWKPVPPADHVDLAALFPGQDNCVAYLRTHVLAPQDLDALLLMGSDDGLKVRLNGEVVHAHNVDRGMVVDQDRAPIRLKRGLNRLDLKVTQGGGGWAVCARLVGTDGKPIAGLRTGPNLRE